MSEPTRQEELVRESETMNESSLAGVAARAAARKLDLAQYDEEFFTRIILAAITEAKEADTKL